MSIPNEVLFAKIKKLKREFDFLAGRYTPDSWQDVQDIVRAGMGHKIFQVGDQLLAEFNGTPVVWVVIGIDHDKPTDPRFTHSLTIQSHDCLLDAQFDAKEPDNPDSDRQERGNNRYLHSAIRQWLNSAETTFTWQPQHQIS